MVRSVDSVAKRSQRKSDLLQGLAAIGFTALAMGVLWMPRVRGLIWWPYRVPGEVLGQPIAAVEAKYDQPEWWSSTAPGNTWDHYFFITAEESNQQYYLGVELDDEAIVSKAEIITAPPYD